MAASTRQRGRRASGGEHMLEALVKHGVDTVFGYPGGAIMPVYDALPRSGLRHILTRHEQAAALAADGFGRVSGRAGVCLATSGPGSTNLITGIANAYLDSVPLLAITGQVGTHLMGTDAFQEVDIFGMTMPVVKHSYICRSAGALPQLIADALYTAESGRPGPVLIDLPKDIASTKLRAAAVTPHTHSVRELPDPNALAATEAAIAQAERPVFYAGGGIGIANAVEQFRELVQATGVPVVATLKGLGAIPTDHPLFLGMLGMHGSPTANHAVQACDLLIAVGARFDDRATGALAGFAPGARVVHLDVDPAEFDKLRTADITVEGDLAIALGHLRPPPPNIDAWRQRCAADKITFAPRYDAPGTGVYAPALLRRLSELGGERLILACDVGQHQMWVAQHCHIRHPRRHLSSGGLGTMGYGLPAAIGAKIAEPDAVVVVVTGDGSLMMNLQELATLNRYGLDIRIVVLDNSALGMVRQWQELFYERNFSEIDLSDNPDFARLARCFGLEAFRVDQRSQVEQGIQRLLAADGPCLMHVPIDARANVWPLVPPGQNNDQMMMENLR